MPRAPKYIAQAAATLPTSAPCLHVGTSGWAYTSWKPGFYPPNAPARAFLHEYAARLGSVEVNYTFTKHCTADQLGDWLAATPPGFLFSFKAPQRITHFKRLLDAESQLEEFLASLAPVRAAQKLGVLLFQFPPNFKLHLDRLAAFLALPALQDRKLRLAFEFRNSAWFCEPVYALLRKHNAALCLAESESIITPTIFTSKTHSYYRLRCPGGYSAAKLRTFAASFTAEAAARQTFVYLKHEDEPTGALNACTLQRHTARLAVKSGAA